MTEIGTILIIMGLVVAAVWLAVFICALSDKIRDCKPVHCEEDEESDDPVEPVPQRTWRQNLMLVPLAVLLFPVLLILGVCIALPMMFVELFWYWGAKVWGKLFKRKAQEA